jgi:GNAT superfamily N-acetyltransferase
MQWRRVSLDDDTERAQIVALVQAHEGSVPGSEPQTEDSVVREMSGTDAEPVELYVMASGESADPAHEDMLLHVEWQPFAHTVWLDVYGEPRVSTGALTQALNDALAYARDKAEPGDWTVETGCYAGDARAAAFYRAMGFEFERAFLRMVLDFDGVRPEAGPLPDGFSIREIVVDDLAGQRVVHKLREDTFRDHWNFHERPFDEWYDAMQTQRDPQHTRRSWVLLDGAEPMGVMIADDSRAELGYGFIGIIGVRRTYRGRGLAKWLLRLGFGDAYDLGRTGVMLTVDSQSLTGADKLYRSVGMHPASEIHAWRRSLFD